MTARARDGSSTRASSAAEIFGFLVVAASAVGIHLLFDRQPLFWDEYYHLLAGRSWASNGVTAIADGVYTRAAWLSVIVGIAFRALGESVVVARLPAAVVTVAWACLLFVWMGRAAGRGPAWIAGLMFALSPLVIVNSVMVRFYAMGGLCTLLAVVLLFTAQRTRAIGPVRRIVMLMGAAAAVAVSLAITPLSGIWVAGALVWVAGRGLHRATTRHGARATLAIAAVVFVGLLAILAGTGALGSALASYREAPLWSVDRAGDARWYEGIMRGQYPTLWPLLPVAVLLAVRRSGEVAWLCLCVWVVSFLLLSGAGAKAERYLLPVMPFYAALWGLAASEVVPMLRAWLHDGLSPTARGAWLRLTPPLMVLGFVLVVGTNPGLSGMRSVIRGETYSLDRPSEEWGATPQAWDEVGALLNASLAGVDVVVTPNSLQTLYHVGDYQFAMRPTVIGEVRPPRDFGVDARTGRPAIGTLAALETVVARHASGVVFGEQWRWGNRIEGFAPDVEAFIRRTMTPIDLPAETRVVAFGWGVDGVEDQERRP